MKSTPHDTGQPKLEIARAGRPPAAPPGLPPSAFMRPFPKLGPGQLPPLPPGMPLPPGIKLENGAPRARWGDIADLTPPGGHEDRISALLHRVRIATFRTGISTGRGAWGVELPALPSAYFAVLSGSVWFATDEGEGERLSAGDCTIICQPTSVRISDGPTSRIRPIFEVAKPGFDREMRGFSLGEPAAEGEEPGPTTRFIGGPLLFDSGVGGPLRSALPQRITLKGSLQGSDGLVPSLLRLLERQSQDLPPGSQAMMNQIATMLFIEGVRIHLSTVDQSRLGWTAALFDEHLGPMLSLLHATPARNWTLEEMANECGLSRTIFAQRFQEMVGIPPATYVREHRMDIAADLLRRSSVDVRTISSRVGYASEPAFCKVFKKWSGMTPGEYRLRNTHGVRPG